MTKIVIADDSGNEYSVNLILEQAIEEGAKGRFVYCPVTNPCPSCLYLCNTDWNFCPVCGKYLRLLPTTAAASG